MGAMRNLSIVMDQAQALRTNYCWCLRECQRDSDHGSLIAATAELLDTLLGPDVHALPR